MEPTVEKEFSALGGLFQHIITDLKNSAPIWEDFLMKASKFHAQLRSTIVASTSFLDSFQKIADMATNTHGATKEIGTALTRLCLRQRSVESKLKIFSNSLQESLVTPLQEKLEEWKKMSNHLDKEHSKEYKRAKQELKKKSSDTLRLQKKVRKVGVIDIRRTLDYALQDVTDKYLLLEETERQSVRKALVEERSHFCLFVGYLQPVLESELTMLNEINHIQEIIDTLSKITGDPHILPETSEQVILDAKSSGNSWSFHTPPGSPGSLGSRKSSVCSISSINSSSSGSLKSHSSRHLSHSQTLGKNRKHLTSVTSQDSGFTSQDMLFVNNSMTRIENSSQLSTFQDSATSSTPSSPVPSATSTWPSLQDNESSEKEPSSLLRFQRPHTISSAYEKSNHRPALTVHTFTPLEQSTEFRNNYYTVGTFKSFGNKFRDQRNCSSQPGTPIYSRPCLPERSDDNSRPKPSLPEKSASIKAKHDQLHNGPSKSLPDFNKTPPDQVVPHPIYANTSDLASCFERGVEGKVYDDNFCRSDSRNEMQNRKEFAAVLNEGLLMQSKWIRGNGNSTGHQIPPAIPKHCRAAVGGSETLPRSRGSMTDDQILQWQMYALSLSNDVDMVMHTGSQRRPMSIAGISPNFLLPRKANTLQRVGSSCVSKPPTPVRRSSSITTSSSQSRISDSMSFSGRSENGSVISGAGEIRYAPHQREFKSSSAVSTPQEKFTHSLRHDVTDKGHLYGEVNRSSLSSSNNSDDGIVTDVSGSRARLIQDLNLAIQQQQKTESRRGSQNDLPAVPQRHSSKVDLVSDFSPKKKEAMADNALYGHCMRQEKAAYTFTAKPVSSHELSKKLQHKSFVKECMLQGDLIRVGKERVDQRQSNGGDFQDNSKLLKRSFVAALNAKLAEHQRQNHSDGETEKDWHMKGNRYYGTWNSGFQRLPSQMCRESLMDQIKKGTRLRRVTCNDRSKPRLA